MESDKYPHFIKAGESTEWYSEEFICSSLINYLKKNGYKIHEEKPKNLTGKPEKIITVSKFFTKEIIGIKGLPPANDRNSLLKVLDKNDSPQAKSWFYESLFNSFINFGKYYSDENAVGAMALPNVERYQAIFEKVQDYFTSNNLYFKLYMINENGDVDVMNLHDTET
ncbi:hypothetical protein [Segetibacter sp.]|jgi:hypothetical protein|uniref:hypothetical protein n=1 Tax=Segetibacter sp. TaxID=2231182 RepID=UPI00260AE2EC|nr:hypothetical protein [Segetibacter sp.]MCW3081064.1 hypothetical protein [Segetibacter sp.]